MPSKKRRIRYDRIFMIFAALSVVACILTIPFALMDRGLKKLGYEKQDIQMIKELGLEDEIIALDLYSPSLVDALRNGTLYPEILPLYGVKSSLDPLDALLARRLMDKGYEEDQIVSLYEKLLFNELAPLLVFDYQWDETDYIEDCLKNRENNSIASFSLDGKYRKAYANAKCASNPESLSTLVSFSSYLPSEYEPAELEDIPTRYGVKDVSLAKEAAQSIIMMAQEAYETSGAFYVSVGYRSNQTQAKMYQSILAQSRDNTSADAKCIRPGFSEHQTGLAVNIASSAQPELPFDETWTKQWLDNRAAAAGWIQRYPLGKASITGIGDEPDHYRYLGRELAILVADSQLTFDEYHALYLAEWNNPDLIPSNKILNAISNYQAERNENDPD